MECKVSWSNCPCGKTLPGFSPKSVLGTSFTCLTLLCCLCSPMNPCGSTLGDLNETYCQPHMLGYHCGVFAVADKCIFFYCSLLVLCTALDRILFRRIFLFKLKGRTLMRKPNISTYSFPYKIVKIIMP